MTSHGAIEFLAAAAAAHRRLSLLAAAIAAAVFLAFAATRLPHFRARVDDALDTARFGFEGPTQYVRRITLQQYSGTGSDLQQIGPVESPVARRGGAEAGPRTRDERAAPETRPPRPGAGEADADLIRRNVSRLPNVPVVRSEDLVIEHSVLPRYPEPLIERGIEGRVMLQALVDTSGQVVDVQVMASSGERPFERSAVEAVRQYRFRPYREDGRRREVYAVFRFVFRIY